MPDIDLFYENGKPPIDICLPAKVEFPKDKRAAVKEALCLPLKLASEIGWELVLPESFEIICDDSGKVTSTCLGDDQYRDFIITDMGSGYLSIRVPYLPRVSQNNYLWFRGPINKPFAQNLFPMEAIVESDWFPANLTMNYRILKPNTPIILSKGSAYCRIFPYPKGYIEDFSISYRSLEEDKSFLKRMMNYVIVDKFGFGGPCGGGYRRGFDGEKENPTTRAFNMPPASASGYKNSRCPFHKLFSV